MTPKQKAFIKKHSPSHLAAYEAYYASRKPKKKYSFPKFKHLPK